ncbi:hypothetical protein D3C73_739120 [compost metagenome]
MIHLHQGRQGDHLARERTHLQSADIIGMAAIAGICLHPHRVGTPELVEIVDIKRAKVDLQRAEDIGHLHPELMGTGTVDVGKELRHIDLPTAEQPGQLGSLGRLGQETLHRLIHLPVPEPAAILKLQLEAPRGAKPLHGGWREHHHHRLLDAGESLVQLRRHRHAALIGASALLERLEHGEHHPGIGAVGEAVD